MPHEKVISNFQTTSLSIYKANFEIKTAFQNVNLIPNVQIDNDISSSKISENNLQGTVILKINLKLKSEGKTFIVINVFMKANFFGQNMNEGDFIEFIKYSGISNMIQVARSYIISITAQSGVLPPVILPMINLMEYFKTKKNKKISTEH